MHSNTATHFTQGNNRMKQDDFGGTTSQALPLPSAERGSNSQEMGVLTQKLYYLCERGLLVVRDRRLVVSELWHTRSRSASRRGRDRQIAMPSIKGDLTLRLPRGRWVTRQIWKAAAASYKQSTRTIFDENNSVNWGICFMHGLPKHSFRSSCSKIDVSISGIITLNV